MKIKLEKLDMHKRVAVEILLDSRDIMLFINPKFAKTQGFKLKKQRKVISVKKCNSS